MHPIIVSSVEQRASANTTVNLGTWVDLPLSEWGGRHVIQQPCQWTAEQFSVETLVDSHGHAQARVPTRIERVTLMVVAETQWTRFEADVRGVHPPTRIAGALSRLHRLGFYHGTLNGEDSSIYREALKAFQEQRGIAVSGELGIETVRALAMTPGRPVLLSRISRSKPRRP